MSKDHRYHKTNIKHLIIVCEFNIAEALIGTISFILKVMKGYFKNNEATVNTLKNEWLHSGDIAYYDETGRFYIVDRLKELIKVKGFQVPPAGVIFELVYRHMFQ